MVKGTHFNTIYDLLEEVEETPTYFTSIVINHKDAKEIIIALIEEGYDFEVLDYGTFEEGMFISICKEESTFDVIPLEKKMPICNEGEDTVFIEDNFVEYIKDKDVDYIVFSMNDESTEIKKSDDGHHISFTDSFADSDGNSSVYMRSFFSTDKDLVDLMFDIWRG